MSAKYSDKQRKSHFESFANTIFTGIREIKPQYAEKRAIWELFQNALDTVDENGIIEISKTSKGLKFKHNGRAFKDDEFGGLIKQFSVGKKYGNNKEKLGQYGTGFISTHVYGKKIEINCSIRTDDGSYRTLKDFLLDRDSISKETLTDMLIKQDDFISDLCDNLDLSEQEPLDYTSFEYIANDSAVSHINSMLLYIESILPYIFCFNDKLKKVSLIQEFSKQLYERVGTNNGVLEITKDNNLIIIPFIQDDGRNVKIILGSKKEILTAIPKQFLFYPLMETSEIGCNFIIHANDFKPNRERDYLHKSKTNDELKADVEINENLLRIAFDTILKKIENDKQLLLTDIGKIEFTFQDSNFERELKEDYINSIKNLERILINDNQYCLSDLKYFDESILKLSEGAKKSIYSLLAQFTAMPSYNDYCEFSKYVNNWNENIKNKFDVINLTNVGEIIEEKSFGNYFYIKDKPSYQNFILIISEDITLLNKLSLLPNIHGKFKHFESLVKWDQFESSLVDIVDNINASISEKYIHTDFEFLENLNIYNREKFKDDFSKFCNDLSDNLSKEKTLSNLNQIKISYLKEFLTKFICLNKKTVLNIELASFYQRVFSLASNQVPLENPTVDTNFLPAMKLLTNIYIMNIDDNDVANDLLDLKELIGIMFKSKNLKEEMLHKLPCIPNQNHILKSQTELKKDLIKDEEFKSKYNEITAKDIRNELACEGFETFLQHSGSIYGSEIGDEIEKTLNSEKKFIPVDPETIDKVLSLIESIAEKPNTWGQWLRNINEVKEEVLMHKFRDDKTRSSLFSILTKNEKTIELLGDLAKITDLEDLVKKGKEKQKEENRANNHLQHINKIGLQIQDLIEKQLGKELSKTIKIEISDEKSSLIAKEEQNGQDFIIYKDLKPLFFIEVKSKWDENGRFALSKNQTEKCAKEKNNYAVITVNVERYKKEQKKDTDNVSFDELYDYVKVNENLGGFFEKLIQENIILDESKNPKLIEYRGSIPQKIIDDNGISFEKFIIALLEKIKNN